MLRIRDIMTRDVVTVPQEATLRNVMELLVDGHLSGVPVMGGDTVVGVVSMTDLLAFAVTTAAADALEPEPEAEADAEPMPSWDDERSAPDEAEGSAGSFFAEVWADQDRDVVSQLAWGANGRRDVFTEHTVAEIMTHELYALGPSASVTAAADLMRTANVHRLLVLEDDRLVGIVTTMDIANAAADNKLGVRSYVFGGRR